MTAELPQGPEIRAYEVVLIRDRLGLDQPTFGRLLGVSERTIRGWENGAVIPASAQFTLQLVRHCAHVRPQSARGQLSAILSGEAITHLSCAYEGMGAEWTPIGDSPMLRSWVRDLDALLGRGPGNGQ